jgi:hypothetical protein
MVQAVLAKFPEMDTIFAVTGFSFGGNAPNRGGAVSWSGAGRWASGRVIERVHLHASFALRATVARKRLHALHIAELDVPAPSARAAQEVDRVAVPDRFEALLAAVGARPERMLERVRAA